MELMTLPVRLMLLGVVLMIAGCAPARAPAPSQGGGQVSGDPAAPRQPKRLTLGILQEPRTWAPWETTTTAGGANQVAFIMKRTLTTQNDQGQLQPDLAVSLPSLERGDWRINPDDTMEQTWKINPNAKWHDGQPVTAEDFVLGFQIETSPDLPRSISSANVLLSGATAVDPQTLVLRFKTSTPLAGQALYFPAPRHILGDALAAGEPDRFVNHDYWTTGFVGTGPYRLASWQQGALQEFSAFPDYVGGRPKIDTVIFKFLSDPNTLLANVISGGVDVALPDGLSVEVAADLKRSWAAPGTGNNVAIYNDGRFYYMEFQHRAEWAKPSAARDPRVRRAFYHTFDKEGVNEVENGGVGLLADSWITPDDPRRPLFRDAIRVVAGRGPRATDPRRGWLAQRGGRRVGEQHERRAYGYGNPGDGRPGTRESDVSPGGGLAQGGRGRE